MVEPSSLPNLVENQDGGIWSEPDAAGIRHYQGPAPAPATVLDAHTYLGPRIIPCQELGPAPAPNPVPFLRVVCVCGWQTEPLPGVLLADAAALYGAHLEEVTDVAR